MNVLTTAAATVTILGTLAGTLYAGMSEINEIERRAEHLKALSKKRNWHRNQPKLSRQTIKKGK